MREQCELCGSTEIEWRRATPARHDEPACIAGWECRDCGWLTGDADHEHEAEVTRAEAMWDDRMNR